MRKRWLLYVVAAACLAAVSPVIASSIDVVDLEAPGLLDWWFVVVPLQADVALQLDSTHRLWVWMAVYFLEHFAVIAALSWVVTRVLARAKANPGTVPA